MSNNRQQRVVLVTGASSGIGKACAIHLAQRGFKVFGAQRRAAEPWADSAGVEMLSMDVNDDKSVNQAVQLLLSRTGRLDAVINNAGFALMGAVEDTSIEEAKSQMETNFFGVLRVCRAVLPAMRSQSSGYIVNISSLAGILGLPFSGLYSASKFALEGMTESLRLETRRFGVKVVLVEPGDFNTEITATRRLTHESETNNAYRDFFARLKAAQDKEEANAPTPEPIALLVQKILESPSPATRYSVGMLGQRIVVPLKKILPQRVFEFVLRKVLDL